MDDIKRALSTTNNCRVAGSGGAVVCVDPPIEGFPHAEAVLQNDGRKSSATTLRYRPKSGRQVRWFAIRPRGDRHAAARPRRATENDRCEGSVSRPDPPGAMVQTVSTDHRARARRRRRTAGESAEQAAHSTWVPRRPHHSVLGCIDRSQQVLSATWLGRRGRAITERAAHLERRAGACWLHGIAWRYGYRGRVPRPR